MTRSPLGDGHVVVAVDGSDEALAAASYAAARARRVGASLDVVHVLPAYVANGPFYPVGPTLAETKEDFRSHGTDVLERARAVARETASDLEIHTELMVGARVHQIVQYAEHGQLIVIGRREHTRVDEIWTGGTITGVASQASCPVVVAPATWDQDSHSRRVVAGYKSPRHAADLLAGAFAAAQDSDADLVVLHAWHLQGAYDDIIARRVSEAGTNREQKHQIWEQVASFNVGYPSVHVKVEVSHQPPAQALVRASKSADRIVILRPAHGGFTHHLGRTARAVLRGSYCPVEVVPPAKASELTMPPVLLEEHGDLVR